MNTELQNSDLKNSEAANNPYQSYVGASNKHQDLNSFISRFLKIVLIHKWLFAAVFAFVMLLVLIYALKQPKMYQSNYEVFYNETMREYMSMDNAPIVKSDFDKNYWLSAMRSNEVFLSTIRNSGLGYSVSQLKSMMVVGVIDKRKEDRIPVYYVSISSKFNEHIPVLIRAYVKALNELLVQNQISNSERLLLYLRDQINQNNQKLNQIDISIMRGGSIGNNEIIDFDKISSTLDQFRADLLNARVSLASIVSARMRTETELANLDGTIVNESAFSEPLKVQLMNLEVDLARSLTRNKEDHPEVKQIRKNIDQISSMIRDTLQQRMEIKSVVQNPLKSQLMSKLIDLKIQEVSETTKVKSLEQIIAELEQKSLPGSINEEQQQTLLNRELVSLTINQLNDKLIETQSTSHGSLSRFVFVDDPSSIFIANRGFWFYFLLALALGLAIASVIVFIYDMLDDRIMLVDDYDRFFSTPTLGVVKHFSDDERTLFSNSRGMGSEQYKSKTELSNLYINLRQLQKLKGLKTFVVASPDRLDGKSLVSMKLASTVASKLQKVLLVDMDFFSPKISSKILDENSKGLSNYLMNEVQIDEIICKTEVDNLHFVSAGDAQGQKELFYNSKGIADFISWAKENYDFVLFDTPAAIYIPDIVDFFDYVDGILVVARLRRTTRNLLNKLFVMLSAFESKTITTVLNDYFDAGDKRYADYSYPDKYINEGNRGLENSKRRRPFRSILFVIFIAVVTILFIAFYLFNSKAIASAYNAEKQSIEMRSNK